jgi:hypothetical protein
MITPSTTIIRRPNGVWIGAAAVPIGTRVFSVEETLDEAPFREIALHHVGAVMGPTAREAHRDTQNGTSAEASDQATISTLVIAKQATDAIVAKNVRKELTGMLKRSVKAITQLAKQLYRRASVSPQIASFSPVVAVATATGGSTDTIEQVLAQVAVGSRDAMISLVEMGRRIPADPNAERFLQDLLQNASEMAKTGSPVLTILHALFTQNGLVKLAQVVALLTAQQPARAG